MERVVQGVLCYRGPQLNQLVPPEYDMFVIPLCEVNDENRMKEVGNASPTRGVFAK
jgi:hypothetical protein